jgi:hypothetical protein
MVEWIIVCQFSGSHNYTDIFLQYLDVILNLAYSNSDAVLLLDGKCRSPGQSTTPE